MLPYEADVEHGTQEPPREITVAGLSPAQPWTLLLFAQGLRLTPQREGEPPIHILRSELATHVDLVNFGVTRRTLVARKPRKRLFKLDPAAWDQLKAWIGRDAHLRIALRQRLGYGVPIGILVLISSLPVPGDAEAGIEGVSFNSLSAALGVLLIAGGILARRRPHPALFLLDSAWFAVLAGLLVWRVVHGGSPLWLILAGMQLLLVWSGLGLFRELSTKPPP